MMNENTFEEMVGQIVEQGYDEETAAHYAVLIGDIPITDAAGNTVVMENGRTIATLKPLKMFS